MSATFDVRAVKWSGGWELHIDEVGVTQVRTLDKAVQQVRDYLETVRGGDASTAEIIVTPDLGVLGRRVVEARAAVREAAAAQVAAARAQREVVAALRAEGLSVTDTAAVLGVSRGRVSQLADA